MPFPFGKGEQEAYKIANEDAQTSCTEAKEHENEAQIAIWHTERFENADKACLFEHEDEDGASGIETSNDTDKNEHDLHVAPNDIEPIEYLDLSVGDFAGGEIEGKVGLLGIEPLIELGEIFEVNLAT